MGRIKDFGIDFDLDKVQKIDKDQLSNVTLLITKKNNTIEHKTFNVSNDYLMQDINVVTRCTLNDLFCFDTYNIIVDIKCPQNILDRSIKFCKQHKAEFLFALTGPTGVTIYVKKNKKSGEFCRTKSFLRYNKYFWKKYKITWNVIEV